MCLYSLKVMLNSQGKVASLPLGSPVVGLSTFNLLAGVFCSTSSADDGNTCTAVTRWAEPCELGQVALRAGEDVVWVRVHYTDPCTGSPSSFMWKRNLDH